MMIEKVAQIEVFNSLQEAMQHIPEDHTVVVASKTGRDYLAKMNLPKSMRIIEASSGEPMLLDLLSVNPGDLRGVRRIVSIGGGSVIDFGKGLIVLAEFPEVSSRMTQK